MTSPLLFLLLSRLVRFSVRRWQQPWQETGQPSPFSRCTPHDRAHRPTTACIPLPRNTRCRWTWKVFHENLRIQSEVREGIHHRVRTSLPSSLLYFPNNGPLKSNFANISARQLCLLPFRSFPRGKGKEGAPPKSRTRRNFFGKRSLPRIVATWSSRRAPPSYVEICAWIEKELEKRVLDIERRAWLKNSTFYAREI